MNSQISSSLFTNVRVLRLLLGVLLIICAAAPSAATIVTKARPFVNAAGPAERPQSRIAGLNVSISVTGPSGCRANSAPSFLGLTAAGDVAGGVDSGVLVGGGNQSCDGLSAILSGVGNRIGGDNDAAEEVIGGGFQNGIEGGQDSFVGAGS